MPVFAGPPRKVNPSERGFTIIEMMIVLAIVAMAMTVAPAIVSGLAGGRLRAASDELIAQLRDARGQAIRRNAPAELVFDLGKRSYSAPGDAGLHVLPAIVDAVDVTPAVLVQQPGRIARIRFLADGSADAARISLRHGTSANVIAIDWLTGRVRHDD
jgi:general secretion pathway protein H